HTNQGPLDRKGVFELIRDQLADILETDPSSITEGASFVEDLDADSLALIELVEELEEELGERTVGFRVDDEDLADLHTVREAVDYVVARLHQALIHRSYCAEHPVASANERLEFLGDAVLGLVVTVYVYEQFPDLPEGELAKLRASVVNAEVLAQVASEI